MSHKISANELAKYFDHTALKPEVKGKDIEILCQEAMELGCAAVCVNPVWIPLASKLLSGSKVMPITVVGFPLGATGTLSKVYETKLAIQNGAAEIDMVLSIGELKSGDDKAVRGDIDRVKETCGQIPLKVIFETSLLTSHEIRQVTKWCAEMDVNFVKTSTGFGSRGASIEDVLTMKKVISEMPGCQTKIKASGGVRTLAATLEFIEAGASRIGASATRSIIAELNGASSDSKQGY